MRHCFEIRDLSFTYPKQGENVLKHLSFSIEQGQFVTLTGPSGCGKSTLLRQLKTPLAPHGTRSGEILFWGCPLDSMDARAQSTEIGFVQQNPDNQIVTDKVWHELAFGLESLGFDTAEIRGRVAEMASFFGIQTWFYKDVAELSGGQKQLLNLASIMAMQPSVLILDEPTSQLDPIAASDFLTTVSRINRELGTTILMTEHRLEEAFPMSDRILVMDGGQLICDDTPHEVGLQLREKKHAMFLAMPAVMRVWASVPNIQNCPVTVREGRDWLAQFSTEHKLKPVALVKQEPPDGEAVLTMDHVWFRYKKDGLDVVKDLSLRLHQGELMAVLGGNGAGKSTALSLMAGIRQPLRGKITRNAVVGVLPQNPQTLFVKKTVREDLHEILNDRREEQADCEKRFAAVVRLCRLSMLLDRHPYDLSGGEQQRAALAKVLLMNPEILLLDEPTKGMDAEFKQNFAAILKKLLERGIAILMVSHDIEFCAEYAQQCALFFDGSIVTAADPQLFFSGNSFYTTAENRMARDILPNAVTAADIIEACGGEIPLQPEICLDDAPLPPPQPEKPQQTAAPFWKMLTKNLTAQHISRRSAATSAAMLLAIPITILAGLFYFEDRKYYFISLLVMLECMLPFFLAFEGRKPQARELVVISVLCALGVTGRAAFFMLPQFKPVMAIVIIAGASLGCETGFLVGAVTMLTSNILFGQGPWTPWQMFAMGLIGFLSGVLFQKGFFRRDRVPLSVFGVLSAVLIYGGIVNLASALIWSSSANWQTILTYYATGLPFDLVQAGATGFFLWFLAKPMMEKLDRIKTKYGIVENRPKISIAIIQDGTHTKCRTHEMRKF